MTERMKRLDEIIISQVWDDMSRERDEALAMVKKLVYQIKNVRAYERLQFVATGALDRLVAEAEKLIVP